MKILSVIVSLIIAVALVTLVVQGTLFVGWGIFGVLGFLLVIGIAIELITSEAFWVTLLILLVLAIVAHFVF